jgi:hypothetical protein
MVLARLAAAGSPELFDNVARLTFEYLRRTQPRQHAAGTM